MAFFHSVAYMVVIFIWCVLCDVTIWCHVNVSKPTFIDINKHIFLHPLTLIYVIALNIEYKLLLALQVGISEKNIICSTLKTQQFITVNISGCA